LVNDLLRKELKTKNFRITAQRELIMKVFAESPDEHLSTEEVYRKLLNKRSRISKATVYRTVELLSELGLLRKLDMDNGIERFELSDSDSRQKTHAICTSCGKVFSLGSEILKEVDQLLMGKLSFSVSTHNLKFYGECSECQEKRKREQRVG